MALAISGCRCQLREVVLKDKPPSMLEFSPKGTVPVLVFADGTVLEESLEIMQWALKRNDPQGWLMHQHGTTEQVAALIETSDRDFKHHLDRFKYATRYQGADPEHHRGQAELFIGQLESLLEDRSHLFGHELSLADVAIGPFVRQFANADRSQFLASAYPRVIDWLHRFVTNSVFTGVMTKYPQWHDGDPITTFG